MSAIWSLLYIDTPASSEAIFELLDRACSDVVDGHVVRHLYGSGGSMDLLLDEHELIRAPEPDRVAQMETPGHPCMLIYPAYQGIVTVGLLYWFSPEQVMDATPRGWARRTAHVAKEDRDGSLAGSVWAGDTVLEAIPQVALRLSAAICADVALMAFMRNPAVDVTAIWFARAGAWVDYYFRRDYEGRINTLHWAKAAAGLFDGRFAFVTHVNTPKSPSGYRLAFHAEDMARPYRPELTTYDARVARLYVPFWEHHLQPVGIVHYDTDALLRPPEGPVTIRAVLPRPPEAIDPRARLRERRLLRLLTRNVPLDRAGLQFRDEASGEESIVFGMEVDWLSPRRIEVDMRRIEKLLWLGREVTMRVRLVECEAARYIPMTPWSEPFIRLGKQG